MDDHRISYAVSNFSSSGTDDKAAGRAPASDDARKRAEAARPDAGASAGDTSEKVALQDLVSDGDIAPAEDTAQQNDNAAASAAPEKAKSETTEAPQPAGDKADADAGKTDAGKPGSASQPTAKKAGAPTKADTPTSRETGSSAASRARAAFGRVGARRRGRQSQKGAERKQDAAPTRTRNAKRKRAGAGQGRGDVDASRLRFALALRGRTASPGQIYTRQRANVVATLGLISALGVVGWYFTAEHQNAPRVVETQNRMARAETPFGAPKPVAQATFMQPLPKLHTSISMSLADLEYEVTPTRFVRTIRVEKGDTFSEVLERAGVPIKDARSAIQSLRSIYDPKKLRQDRIVSVEFGVSGQEQSRFIGIRFEPRFDKNIHVERQPNGDFVAAELKKDLRTGFRRSDGQIEATLYDAARNTGAPASAITQMIHLFSFAVDFQRDIQKGDRFEILYEVHQDTKGNVVRAGAIAYASLTLRGTVHRLYRFQPNKKDPAIYLNGKGEGNRKALMKTPIDGARLTSNFGYRRHPILGYSKLHTGADFGAPTGTPIYAAGDGTITKIGWFGGYGRYISIRHNKEYATAYAHMSRFRGGLKAGSRVKQGQVIGYVGTTGRSTGPHLHYEVRRYGKFINPQTMTLPSRKRISGSELVAFMKTKKKIDTMFEALGRNGRSGKLLTVKNEAENSGCKTGLRLDPTDTRPCE